MQKPITRKRWDCLISRIPKDRHIIGAEIGVLRGYTSENVLRTCPNVFLYLVDPWSATDRDESYIQSGAMEIHKDQNWYDTQYEACLMAIKPYHMRNLILRKKSIESVEFFGTGCLDFVFIDGDHSYDGVMRDIKAWLPKIKQGGFIGGHDYGQPRFAGLTKAVDEVFSSRGIENDADHTWFVRL